MKITKILLPALALAAIATGCATSQKADVNVAGTWRIAAYMPYDATSNTLVDTKEAYEFTFEGDGNFYCGTDCNSIGGIYILKGDSIRFDNMMSTKMACPEENVERGMSVALPQVRTLSLSSDSVLSLKNESGNVVVKLSKN